MKSMQVWRTTRNDTPKRACFIALLVGASILPSCTQNPKVPEGVVLHPNVPESVVLPSSKETPSPPSSYIEVTGRGEIVRASDVVTFSIVFNEHASSAVEIVGRLGEKKRALENAFEDVLEEPFPVRHDSLRLDGRPGGRTLFVAREVTVLELRAPEQEAGGVLDLARPLVGPNDYVGVSGLRASHSMLRSLFAGGTSEGAGRRDEKG